MSLARKRHCCGTAEMENANQTFYGLVLIVGDLVVDGNISATGNLLIGGNAAVTGTFEATGATTLDSTLGVTGLTTLSTLTSTGTTQLGKTSGDVTLGEGGGTVYVHLNATKFQVNSISLFTDNVQVDSTLQVVAPNPCNVYSFTSASDVTFNGGATKTFTNNCFSQFNQDVYIGASGVRKTLKTWGNLNVGTALYSAHEFYGVTSTFFTPDTTVVVLSYVALKPIVASSVPSELGSPATGNTYCDDGTNTLSGAPALRFFDGSAWGDIPVYQAATFTPHLYYGATEVTSASGTHAEYIVMGKAALISITFVFTIDITGGGTSALAFKTLPFQRSGTASTVIGVSISKQQFFTTSRGTAMAGQIGATKDQIDLIWTNTSGTGAVLVQANETTAVGSKVIATNFFLPTL